VVSGAGALPNVSFRITANKKKMHFRSASLSKSYKTTRNGGRMRFTSEGEKENTIRQVQIYVWWGGGCDRLEFYWEFPQGRNIDRVNHKQESSVKF